MFGFLSPRTRLPQWRRSYARVCQHQRALFGLSSLPFLSYEAAFLYQAACDSGLISQLPGSAPTCCKLRRLREAEPDDRSVGRYAAAFGMLLAGIKLDDDVADSGRVGNRLLRWKYRKQVATARSVLDRHSPGLVAQTESIVAEHMRLEALATPPPLEDYTAPTGRGFGLLFEQLHPGDGTTFRSLGEAIGRAIIAWDCAVDFEFDRIHGHYTPLNSQSDVEDALHFCRLQLATAGWQLPVGSVSRKLLLSVSQRVAARMQQVPRREPTRLLERWGLIREKGFAYAGCDGCEAACAVTECCGGGAECCGGIAECAECGGAAGSAGCCAEQPVCCIVPDAACCCGDAYFSCCDRASTGDKQPSGTGRKLSGGNTSMFEPYLGHSGRSALLDPIGYVEINGEQLAARSESGGIIDAGTVVTVVGTDEFGVVVRKAEDGQESV